MKLVEKEILQERRRFAWRVFALSAAPVLLVLALAQGILYFAGLRLAASNHPADIPAFEQAWRMIMAVSLLTLLASAWKGYRTWKDSLRQVGRHLDETLDTSKNRLEASAELSHASDPLALAQRQETSDYLARNPARQRSYTLALAATGCVALLLVNGTMATKFVSLVHHSQALAEAKKPDSPKVAARQPYAKIDIVAPESEIRATPVEEVVVKAKADSDNGFSAISLQASINGAPNKTTSIDPAPFNKGGPVKFDQSLFIDELGAQPYDVVGYYLEGTSRHETPLKVASQIQFIEIRPFREDIHKALGGKGAGESFRNLQSLVSQQIVVLKRTWILATNQLPATNPEVAAETGKTGEQQDKIAGETHQVYQEMTENGVPASIVDHISQAETSMRQAVDKIKKPALLEANPIQQHALGELVAATKDFVKTMMQNQDSASKSSPASEDFKDKQKLPPTATSANAMAKLQQIIQREQTVVKNLSPSPSDEKSPDDSSNQPQGKPQDQGQTAQNQSAQGQNSPPQDSPSPSSGQSGQQTAQNSSSGGQNPANDNQPQGSPQTGPQTGPQMAQEQARIGKDLEDLQNQPETPASSTSAMSEAQQAAQSSADKLAAEDQTGALNDARRAEAAMLRARTAMEAEAGQQMRDALAQAQQQLQNAAQMERAASTPSDQAPVKDQTAAARDNIAQERDRQATAGDPRLAQRAGNLLKQYDQTGIPQKLDQLAHQPGSNPQDRAAAADAIRRFADQLSAERLAMQSETQNLEDTLKRVDRIQANMNAARGTPEQQAQLAHELQADLNTALSDANVLLPPGHRPGDNGAPAPDQAPGKDIGGGTGPVGGYGNLKAPLQPTSPIAFQPLREPLAAFRQEIENRLEYLHSQLVLSYLNPDQSPEEYRAQVAAYYERISREVKAAPSNPSAQPPSP